MENRLIEERQEKCEALALRKREELEKSLEEGQVGDPISILVSVAISTALAGASYLIATALTPKPPPQQTGKLSGSLQIMNSEQGLMIPEIYGGGPSVALVSGSNPTYADIANCTQGAGGQFTKTSGGSTWNAGGSHNTSITSGDAFFKVTILSGYAGAGFGPSSTFRNANTDLQFGIQWNPDRSITLRYSSTSSIPGITTWSAGDVFRLEIRSGKFKLYKNSAEVVIQDAAMPAPSYPLYMGIAIQNTGAGVSESKIQIGNIGNPPNYGVGGIKVPAIIPWTSGIRKIVTTTEVGGGGKGFGGGGSQTVENISYNIDLAVKFAAHGPHRFLRLYANADVLIDQMDQSVLPSGVYDPGVGADDDYDPYEPPDPQASYMTSIDRLNADISFDPDGTGGGSIQGGGAGIMLYTGTTTQQPDPTIEADVDGRYGTGSTPAWRTHSYGVLNTFSLSRWGGIVPNITGVLEHETLKTLDDIYGSLCERVNVKAANSDYDFSGISSIASRGLLIAGRLFSPAEVIDSPEIKTVYNYFVTEAEGQIVAFEEGDEPSITIDDTEVGWLDSDTEVSDILPEVDTFVPNEIELARQIDVKYIDPEKDWDANTQSDNRQITEGVSTELLEVQVCLLPDEARSAAQRKLYRDYVQGTAHKFTLPWTYIYLYPGYRITITRAEGFTHVLKLTSITGGIGILECEGVAIEPASFTQPAVGSGGPPWVPPIPIPAMTILGLLDTPILRDGDSGAQIGRYMYGLPRTGVKQKWTGFALFISRNNEWVRIGDSTIAATAGTVVSVSGLSLDSGAVDNVGVMVVDLYGVSKFLTSVTEAQMVAGENRAVAGNMFFGFASAVQVPDYPNRWTLTVLLNGQRGTEDQIPEVIAGSRFVLFDNAVKFVPMEYSDLNTLRSYRAVTVGQSLGDAATVTDVWTGRTMRPTRPTNITVYRDAYALGSSSAGQVQLSIPGSSTPGPGETLRYAVDVYPATPDSTFTVDASTNVFTATSHGLTSADTIAFSTTGTLPKGLKPYRHYFLRDITTHTFKLALESGGTAIDILSLGTGSHSYSKRLRHMPVIQGMTNPVVIDDGVGTSTTAGSGGWLQTITSDYYGGNDVGHIDNTNFDNLAVFGNITESGYFVEFSINLAPKSGMVLAMSFVPLGSLNMNTAYYQMHFTLETSLPAKFGTTARRWQLRIKESATGTSPATVFTNDGYELPETRYRMQISGSEVRYYRHYTGPGSELIYKSVIPAVYPMAVHGDTTLFGYFLNVHSGGRTDYVTTYPAADQIADTGITPPPTTFRYRVYEEREFQNVIYQGDATDFIT